MGKPAFTPGPWVAGGPQWSKMRRTPETQKRAITSAGHPVVANAYGEANASLIAAAPELYAALAELLDNAADIDTSAEGNDCALSDFVRAMDKARVALAKASA